MYIDLDLHVAVMYKLIVCVLILSALIQESVQDGNCPVCGAPTDEALITSTLAGSFSKTRQRRQATINPEPGMCLKSSLLSEMHCICGVFKTYSTSMVRS